MSDIHNDSHDSHDRHDLSDRHDRHGLPADDALNAIATRLDLSAASYAAERPGLADRVFARSVTELHSEQLPATLAFVGARTRRWALAAAAIVMLAGSVAIFVFGGTPPRAPNIMTARAVELTPMSGSEALLVAFIDSDTALGATDGGSAFDASAIGLTTGRSVDDVTVELDELLAAGGQR